jgi:thioredoxin reductase/Pyruvate/2-oxoacid:ferredoxin oxidoreductase delta subunit
MGIPGEDGPGVYSGTDFLNRANSGRELEIGTKVVVVGGGDTAIDAARVSLRLGTDAASMSRRLGAHVTILYRRTRTEMPAISREIEEAVEEGISLEFLAAPARVIRDESGKIIRLAVQRFELGEPDSSGRRRPVAIEGAVDEIEADTLIMAVSQEPDWSSLGAFGGGSWLKVDEFGRTDLEKVWSGGDTLSLGLATISIGQGRKAADAIHATLRAKELQAAPVRAPILSDKIKLNWYPAKTRGTRTVFSPEERLAKPMDEVDLGMAAEAALEETTRCFSCGLCFDCENCWMYCQSGCFKKKSSVELGTYFEISLPTCDGCKKCAEECPCGFLELV